MDVECWAFYALSQETNIYVNRCMKWSGKCNYIFMPVDIIRFMLVCILFIEIKNSTIYYVLLTPSFLFIIFTALADIYFFWCYCVNQTKHEWNSNDHSFKLLCKITSFWCCLIVIGNALNVIFQSILWFIGSYTTFHWRMIWIYPHYANRFFTNINDNLCKQYIEAFLKYSLNHNKGKKETLKRIIATNYYLITMFMQEIDECNIMDEYETRFMDGTMFNHKTHQHLINKFVIIHNNFVNHIENVKKLEHVKWSEIGNGFEGFTGHCMIPITFFLIYIIFYTLMVISLYIYLSITQQINNEYIYLFILYIMMEIVYLPFNLKLYSLASYSCFILPNIINIKSLEWNEKFEVDTMMEDIETVYDIMYQTTAEIEAIYRLGIHQDIAFTIVQYLFIELPYDASKLESVIAQFNTAENNIVAVDSVDCVDIPFVSSELLHIFDNEESEQ